MSGVSRFLKKSTGNVHNYDLLIDSSIEIENCGAAAVCEYAETTENKNDL